VAPCSSRVSAASTSSYITGVTDQFEQRSSYLTISYDASTGETLRRASYIGPADGKDVATAIAMSPEGATVYVTGWSAGTGTALDYATIAYTARNLRQLWVSRYDGPGHHEDQAVDIAVTPDGRAVEVTGFSSFGGDAFDFDTVSYRA
jgi:hypothetical protein